MGWTVPLSAVANTGLTAGQWNASVRDNLLETTPGKATSQRRIFVTDGDNKIAERQILDHIIDTDEETTSLSYADLYTLGPTVTMQTGFGALVWTTCWCDNSSTTNSRQSYAVSGDTTTAAADNVANEADGGSGANSIRSSVCSLTITNPGINTIACKYKVTGGTGTFGKRRILVMGL